MLITGNIDLSVGSVMGVCAISMAHLLKLGLNYFEVLLAGMVIGALVGGINGLFVSRLHLAGIVVTIGTQVMLRGVCYIPHRRGVRSAGCRRSSWRCPR